MNYSIVQLIVFFAVVAVGTFLTRSVPFFLFPEKREIPRFIKYWADILPHTIIGMLVVYCLKEVSLTQNPYALPEAISILIIVILHLYKKNTLLSIGVGALCYMLLVQFVFK